MKTLLTALAVVVVLVLAGIGFIVSGVYDVSASVPDRGLIRWALVTTQEHSVRRAAAGIKGKIAVPNLEDEKLIRTGLVHYNEMCTTCHGAPGVKISEIGQGLNPDPPELSDAGRAAPEETFWVVKNGIKMTGMPSFGVTHTDDEIWAIVAFVRRMGKLTPEQYQAMVQKAGLKMPESEEAGEAPAAASAPPKPTTPK
ncbi:MAG TPA: cytochrome c [Thermoanaerobaculia bacterium]|nr:cytochrome c [Thermoanaerobaculia bacterium]